MFIAPYMVWTKHSIIAKLKHLHKSRADLSYNALARSQQPLVSAAAYHFGSYRQAIQKAGIQYRDVLRRPRWTKAGIVKLIKQGKRKSLDLHWSAVTRRRDDLGRAAFASLQPRLFGSWDRALHAAGLDAEDISRYRRWDRNTILFELKQLSRDEQPMNSGAVQKSAPGLHAAAVRHFGNYDSALMAAKLDPSRIRRRRKWNKKAVVRRLRELHARDPLLVTDSMIRHEDASVYGASVRLFGSLRSAKAAARVGK